MLDQQSPVAPARVRVLLLPIGQIKRARFSSFVERLQPENVVQLGDISPDGRPHRNMFSPLAFPAGMVLYDLTTFYPPASHLSFSPFELYREPLVILAVADGVELDHISYRGEARRSMNGNGPPRPEHNLRELYQDLEDLRDRYPKALVHQVLLFDYIHKTPAVPLPEGLVAIPPIAECKRTTIKTIMCDISSLLLAEMTTLAKSLQALNTIESPSQSQLSREINGATWSREQIDELSRRNSQYSLPLDSRSSSPAANGSRSRVRMSMPAQLSRANSNPSSIAGRPGTPLNGTHLNAAVTSGENLSSSSGDLIVGQKSIPSRFATPDTVRDSSRDRVSMQGFGSGSVSERSRNKGKGRIGVVIGSLYLVAGRWGDALRELSDGADIARNNLDHLWHAKALDSILVGMLMFAWAGLDFQIPQVCYVSSEKATSASNMPEKSANLRKDLTVMIPELVDRILNLYTRAANNTGESLPQLPFSETAIRFSKLLSAIHLGGGVLDNDVLQHAVLGTPLRKAGQLSTPRLQKQPTRSEISTTVFRAFPTSPSPEVVSVIDRILILSGMASVLGSVGYHRKRAMVVRELLPVLISGLVQARIKGAADMGVHPAAGLAALNAANGNSTGAGVLDLGGGDVETGVDAFLGSLCQIYGVVTSSPSSQGRTPDHLDEIAAARILQDAALRSFGGHDLKMDVLRSCVNLCEALPDFHGVLRFTADLLRTAGSGVAPGPRSDNAAPSMSREEQVRLATNISRTISAARNLGVKDLAAEYWDEFLVRGVDLEALPLTKLPIPHSGAELPGSTSVATSLESNPFIYSHFSRPPDIVMVARLLIAGEGAVFKVTLQNPYEFDVEIESIKLEADVAVFESSTQKTVIGPYRTQILNVPGMPKTPGKLKITGCIIRVRGCRERRFPIYAEPWSPQREIKVKGMGLAPVLSDKVRPLSHDSAVATSPPSTAPKATSLELNVIDQQPVVVVKSTTLSQSALMVLEGERRPFSITLQNLSNSTPVDLILFSFKDSTQAPLENAMSNRDVSPAELYEYELIYAKKQALRWIKKAIERLYIEPGGTATFEIGILGKPGLTSAVIQIDYGYLGASRTNVQETFYTRQVKIPLTITVNASIELARMDILSLAGNIPSSLRIPAGSDSSHTQENLLSEEYCLLILDLRNAWPSPLQVYLDVINGHKISEEILPGNTSRIISIIPRIYLSDPWAAIPVLDPLRQRQFVVSTGKISADVERASREAFWYREEILKMLNGRWSTKTGPKREGMIEFRGMRLTPRIIDVVRIDDVDIELSIGGAAKLDGSRYEIGTDSFSELRIRITNRTPKPIYPLLRLQPSLRNHPNNISLDLSKRFVWNGTLQQTLPLLQGNKSIELCIGITPLCRGEFEISASVEETRIANDESGVSGSAEKKEGRPRANTRTIMDAILGRKERRMWHSREPCLVVVTDEESD